MDATRFDTIVKLFAARKLSRRGALARAGAIAAGLTGARLTDAAAAQRAARQPNGAACSRATDCASLKCVDGVCCNSACTGQCESCATGTCRPVVGVPVGNRAACPGSGPCQATCDGITRAHCAGFPGAETACGDPTCADRWQTTYACSGNGSCVPVTTSCGLSACGPTACLDTCATDDDCVGAAFCAGGVCQGDRPLGEGCASDDQCQSGVCAQGVCCASACPGGCEACNLPGSEGFCTVVADGDSCAGGTCCDGACVDTSSSLEHCGTCDVACRLAPAPGSCENEPICVEGTCGFSPLPQGTVCREAAGICDAAEVCDGRSPVCPTGAFQPATVECRPAAGQCDAAEFCTGSSATCPADALRLDRDPCDGGVCCGGACVDLATDATNCGQCGFLCDAGVACVQGICEQVALVLFDPDSPNPDIDVDDDLTVYLNEVAIFVDVSNDNRPHPPIAFTARTGDTLRIVATDANQPNFHRELTALALRRVRDGAVQVLDAAGVPRQVGEAGVFYDKTFTIDL